MTTLRLKTNLNCGACVASVTPYLNELPGIARWNVDTDDPRKTLTIEGDNLSESSVRAAVARAGFQVLGSLEPASVNQLNPATAIKSKSAPTEISPTTYYPLILLLAFLVGIVGIVEWRADTFHWERAMQNFMGGFFIAFAFFKLLDLRGFADSYRMYDVVARQVPVYGYVYPFIELGLGVAYLLEWHPQATNIATIVVMSVGAIGVVQSLLQKRQIRCACLGTVFNLPMSTVTLIEDTSMIAMAGAMLIVG